MIKTYFVRFIGSWSIFMIVAALSLLIVRLLIASFAQFLLLHMMMIMRIAQNLLMLLMLLLNLGVLQEINTVRVIEKFAYVACSNGCVDRIQRREERFRRVRLRLLLAATATLLARLAIVVIGRH